MQIEKAYLFGKQITAGVIPPPPPLGEGVYFDSGRFNPLYIPSGFNLSNQLALNCYYDLDHYYDQNYYDNMYENRFPGGEWASHFDDGTVFLFKDANDSTSDLTISNDYITYRPPTNLSVSVTTSFVLPVVDLGTSYSWLWFRYKITHTGSSSLYTPYFRVWERTSQTTLNQGYFADSGTDNDWVESAIDLSYSNNKADFISFDFSKHTSYPDYTVEIEKIWASNTSPY